MSQTTLERRFEDWVVENTRDPKKNDPVPMAIWKMWKANPNAPLAEALFEGLRYTTEAHQLALAALKDVSLKYPAPQILIVKPPT